ncbi:hypothetical protein FIU87_10360 [Bacillus sp. THAF10]|uniref:CBO0543 family protein n=1 Tax=Bacillus sp. THAF10 TaxID=2587848 RepID=UPI001268E624|nr:CBO0543 family protein [Bacillus sp. THAF10]QFT89049.1 hypothetical protein FIU87_10360 [Bacillus sp. THAF10]
MDGQNRSWNEILSMKETFRDHYFSYWISNDLFSFAWWLILVLNIVFIFVAIKLLDRTRLFEILTVGGLVVLLSSLLDTILIQYCLTAYPTSLIPLIPPFFTSSTYVILPVLYMLLYQYFSTWKSFLIANVITGAFLAFVVENVYRWLNIYQYLQWNSFFSLLMYVGIAIVFKSIMVILLKSRK